MYKSNNIPSTKKWQCVKLNENKITPYDQKNFDTFSFCVHVNTLPACCLNPTTSQEPIKYPVASNDGVVYDKPILTARYTTVYQQYLFNDIPQQEAISSPAHALYLQDQDWKVFIFHEQGLTETLTLPMGLRSNRKVENFLSEQYSKLSSMNHKQVIIKLTPEINQFLLKKSQHPHKEIPIETAISPVTKRSFSPHDQRPVRFSCSFTMPSRLDPSKNIAASQAMTGIFRSGEKTFIMIEERDEHHCGCITVYNFSCQKNTENSDQAILAIRESRFDNDTYWQIDQLALLNTYDINKEQLKARTIAASTDTVKELKTAIEHDKKRIQTNNLRYCEITGKILVKLMAFFAGLGAGDVEYHNEATWCIALFLKVGILENEQVPAFDPHYDIINPQHTWSALFFGARQEHLLPCPKESNDSNPEQSPSEQNHPQ